MKYKYRFLKFVILKLNGEIRVINLIACYTETREVQKCIVL